MTNLDCASIQKWRERRDLSIQDREREREKEEEDHLEE